MIHKNGRENPENAANRQCPPNMHTCMEPEKIRINMQNIICEIFYKDYSIINLRDKLSVKVKNPEDVRTWGDFRTVVGEIYERR